MPIADTTFRAGDLFIGEKRAYAKITERCSKTHCRTMALNLHHRFQLSAVVPAPPGSVRGRRYCHADVRGHLLERVTAAEGTRVPGLKCPGASVSAWKAAAPDSDARRADQRAGL